MSAGDARALARISPANRSALLAHLAVLDVTPPPPPMQELWTVPLLDLRGRSPGARIDLRLLEGSDFRRTTLIRDAASVAMKSSEWRDKLLEAG